MRCERYWFSSTPYSLAVRCLWTYTTGCPPTARAYAPLRISLKSGVVLHSGGMKPPTSETPSVPSLRSRTGSIGHDASENEIFSLGAKRGEARFKLTIRGHLLADRAGTVPTKTHLYSFREKNGSVS